MIANHMALILHMLTGGQRRTQCFAKFANQLICWRKTQARLRTLQLLENESHVYVLCTNATARK